MVKMDKTLIIVCSVVGSLGALSAILGFSAEGTKLTPYTILVYGDDCIYPQNPALGLGICAVLFLLAAQITISAVGGCCGCCKSRSIPSETKRIVGIICAVASWIAAVIAWALLIEGASWNANVVRVSAPFCPYLKDGIFAGGGVLALAATALGITSFIMLRKQPPAQAEAATPAASSVGATPSRPGGQSPSSEVVMGHPLLPLPSKAQHPPKPQAAYGQQVPPAAVHPQNLESPPPAPPPAAAQDDGFHGSNHQFPPQGVPAAAASPPAAAPPPAVAYAPSEQGEQQQPPALAPLGVAMGQTQVSLPQVHVANGMPQYGIPIPAPQVDVVEIPAPLAPAPNKQGNGLSTVIRNELTRATIRFAEKAMEHAVFANNAAATSTTAGGDILSMVTDPTGGDVGATDYRDTTA